MLHSLRVSEKHTFADAAVTGIEVDLDDFELIQQRHPDLLEGLPPDTIVLSNDRARIDITVENQGRIPLDVGVGLHVTDQTGKRIPTIWLRDDGSLGFENQDAEAQGLPPQSTTTVRFRALFSQAAPGPYVVQAEVEALNAIDTNPRNDRLEKRVQVLPYRDMVLDPAQSRVTPLIGVADQFRTVEVFYANRGNVGEQNVTLEADIVELRGPEIVDLTTPIVFDAHSRQIAARDTQWSRVTWGLNPENLFGDDETVELEELFQPGVKYAVRVTINAQDDSVMPWWDTNTVPIPPGFPEDITRPVREDCGCMLLPFYVDDLIARTDLSAANTITQLEDTYPVESLLGDWTVTTLLEGEQLMDDDRPDLPRWQRMDALEIEGEFTGSATGDVWFLPPYQGRERLTHVIESPPLPAHVVHPDSRAVLHARYASLLEEDQARLEVSRFQGGRWSDHEPVDQTRSQRVAIVLAPDFPRVISDALSSVSNSYNVGIGNHPLPPFYMNPLDDPRIVPCVTDTAGNCLTGQASEDTSGGRDDIPPSASCRDGGSLCRWSPFPTFPENGNPEWVDALNETLQTLIGSLDEPGVGADNIRIYSTLNPDFRLPIEASGTGLPAYRVEHENVVYEFPIADLGQFAARLDTFNAILLMGDNTTVTYAQESSPLRGMGFGPDDALNRPQSPLAREHHERLDAILREAPDAGVSVIGTIGPAAGTFARSGAAGGASIVAWQNWDGASGGDTRLSFPQAGASSMRRPFSDGANDGLRCTAASSIDGNNLQNNDDNRYRTQIPDGFVNLQPLAGCRERQQVPGGQPNFPVDDRNPRNYQYFSPYDAQALAIRNFVQQGANLVLPTVGVSMGGTVFPVNQPSTLTSRTDTGMFVVSSPEARHADQWARTILGLLPTTGALPAGTGQWEDLPEALSFPVAGDFFLDSEGMDRFDGSPFRFRIVVESDPMGVGGHAAFALDEIGLFGTPMEQALGIEIARPFNERAYAPGTSPFPLEVVAINRGINPTLPRDIELSLGQWRQRLSGQCDMVLPSAATSLTGVDGVPGLQPGGHAVVSAGLSGAGHWRIGGVSVVPMPEDIGCDMEGADNVAWINFTARLKDDDTRHAFDQVSFRVGHIRQLETTARLTPNVVPVEGADAVKLYVTTRNEGTASERVTYRVTLEEARWLPCVSDGRRSSTRADADSVFHACRWTGDKRDTDAVPSWERVFPDVLVRRDAGDMEFTFPLRLGPDGDDPLGPGIYRVLLRQNGVLQSTQYLHLVAPEGIGPPDRFMAVDGTSLRNLPVAPGQWPARGITVQGQADGDDDATHDGTFGPNPRTQQGDYNNQVGSTSGIQLSHGWLVAEEDDCPGEGSCFEWRRDPVASYPNQGTTTYADGLLTRATSAEAVGLGDFGPDNITWTPYDPNDPSVPVREAFNRPYLTLASLQDPVLKVQARWEATPYTAFTVQAQFAQRVCNDGQPTFATCSWSWVGADAVPLVPRIPAMQGFDWMAPDEVGNVTGQVVDVGTTGQGLQRLAPTNPLAMTPGIWGQNAPSSGPMDWVTVEYPLGDLPEAMQQRQVFRLQTGDGGFQESGDLVSRPVRFVVSAASFGGDSGTSILQVSHISLSGHGLELQPNIREFDVDMMDDDTDRIPIRIHNSGYTDDEIRVSWRPGGARTALPDTTVTLCLEARCDRDSTPPGSDGLTFPVPAGESRVIWARIDTDITTRPPGSIVGIPFTVEATSVWDPTATVEVLLDAAFRTRAWSDLHVQNLVLDGDTSQGGFQASNGVPVQASVVLRNRGHMEIGSQEEPVQVRLVERSYTSDGTVVAERDVATHWMTEPLPPFRQTQEERFITFGEWVPPEQGLFELVVLVNQPRVEDGALPVPDQPSGAKSLARGVAVGPVRFADLHITDVWLVPFGDAQTGEGGCSIRRVDRAIAGHAYCVAANVENRGRQPALDPVLRFGIGVASPFSVRELENPFPPQDTRGSQVVVTSSPWVAALRPDGSNEWSFYSEITAASFSPVTENKWRELRVPVDRYALRVDGLPSSIPMEPGEASVFEFNVTNQGNAPVTPIAHTEGGGTRFRAHVDQAPILLPGETETVRLAVHASPGVRVGDETPRLFLTAEEDPNVRIRLPVEIQVVPGGSPDAAVLPLETIPGAATFVFAVDNSDSTVPTTWVLEETTLPLETGPEPWKVRVEPGERRFVDLPLRIANHTAPGPYEVSVGFLVQHDGHERQHTTVVTVDVIPEPVLDVSVLKDRMVTGLGHGAPLEVKAFNSGNLPLEVRISHQADEARIQPAHPSGPVVVPAGAVELAKADVFATDASHVLGASLVEWRPAGTDEPWKQDEHLWQVDYVPGAVRILRSDLDSLRLRPSGVQEISVTVQNPLEEPVEAEILLVVDALVQSQATTSLGPAEDRLVQLPFSAKDGGTTHQVLLVARPLGSQVTLEDPAFHLVADSQTRSVEVEDRMVPFPGIGLLLAAMGILLLWIVRIRHRRDAA